MLTLKEHGMPDGAKNLCDACAIAASAFTFLFQNAPQIAAVLSVIWLALRIIEWGYRVYTKGLGSADGNE